MAKYKNSDQNCIFKVLLAILLAQNFYFYYYHLSKLGNFSYKICKYLIFNFITKLKSKTLCVTKDFFRYKIILLKIINFLKIKIL